MDLKYDMRVDMLFTAIEKQFDSVIEKACVDIMSTGQTMHDARKIYALSRRQEKMHRSLARIERDIFKAFDEITE